MIKLLVAAAGLFLLTGCFDSGILTGSAQLEEYIEDYPPTFNEHLAIYFEREQYGFDQLDEVFYKVENHSDQPIEMSEVYSIQKYEEEKWTTIENHIHESDRMVEILPNESTEQVIWISSDGEKLGEGIYRIYTTLHYPDKTEVARQVSPKRPAVNEEVSLLFEVK